MGKYEPNAARPKAEAPVKPLMILEDATEWEEAMREGVPGDGGGVQRVREVSSCGGL